MGISVAIGLSFLKTVKYVYEKQILSNKAVTSISGI